MPSVRLFEASALAMFWQLGILKLMAVSEHGAEILWQVQYLDGRVSSFVGGAAC